jgi:hypothetical protein
MSVSGKDDTDLLVIVGPDHPAWAAFLDDDWNGATFDNWVTTLRGKGVILKPARGTDESVICGVRDACFMVSNAVLVIRKKAKAK